MQIVLILTQGTEQFFTKINDIHSVYEMDQSAFHDFGKV